MNVNDLEELTIKIHLLEEEMKFLREQIQSLKKDETNIYQQLIAKYQEPMVQEETKLTYKNKEYIVDKNNFLWDMDGYVCGWLNENNEVILNK
jgi:SMC interacting uncharacterized protein involved in chromosome segregation